MFLSSFYYFATTHHTLACKLDFTVVKKPSNLVLDRFGKKTQFDSCEISENLEIELILLIY